MKKLITELKQMVDDVRLVDPSTTAILDPDAEGCCSSAVRFFQVWDSDHRCSNCISMQTLVERTRKSKCQIVKDRIHHVVSCPIILEEDGNERIAALEIVMEMTDALLEHSGIRTLKRQLREAQEQLYMDELTGNYNRRYLNECAFLIETNNIRGAFLCGQ